MKIALAQINPTVGDIQGNLRLILSSIKNAKEKGVELVVFPEMALCGYPPEDLVLLPHFIQELEIALKEVVKETTNIAVVLGTVRKTKEKGEKNLHNTAAIIENGTLLGFQDKTLLPTYDVFYERRYFEPAAKIAPWKLCGKNVGVTICEDIWEHAKEVGYSSYTIDPILELKKHPLDLVINLSCSPYYAMRPLTRIDVCKKVCRTLQKPFLLCNQVGGNDSLIFDGHSIYLDAAGNLCSLGKGFATELLIIDTEKKCSQTSYQTPVGEELFQALTLGIRDYFGKLGFKKAVLGISGGIDSAIVASLAKEALGHENVLGVSMPSRYTSTQSTQDAKKLAHNLQIELKEIPIEECFESFLAQLEPHFAGKKWDVTEENLQARIRGVILMALSNKWGHLVLSCANKSEMSMGYSTLYGDMCGAIAPLGDISKAQIYQLAEFINSKGEVIPKSILQREPTAELKENQKDSDTLPPYPVLDLIMQEYVENTKDPETIAKEHGIELKLVKEIVKKIHQNEYKRRQAPLLLRVSRKAFNVGRRFPIVQKWND